MRLNLLLSIMLVSLCAGAQSIDYWTTHSLEKLFPDSTKPGGACAAIDMKAARGEIEDAQVAIRVPKDVKVDRAAFTLSELKDTCGNTIAKENIHAWWEWYTYVLNTPKANKDPESYLRKAPAFFPDAFLESPTIEIRDEWTQPLWVSVNVPPEAKPGLYTGQLEISLHDDKNGDTKLTVPLSLKVWGFTLPREPRLHHTEWFSYGGLAEYYRIPMWSEEYWRWVEKVAADMGRHRQDTILTPFNGLVDVSIDASGKMQFDFSRLDRWVETFRKAGVTWIEGGHVAGRSGGWESQFVWARFGILGPDKKPLDISAGNVSEEQYEPYVRDFLQGIHAHMKEKGWADRYVQHIADEPTPENRETWKYRAKRVHEWLPGVPVIDAVMSSDLEDVIDISVPQIQHIEPKEKRGKGEIYWSYVCLYPQGEYPNRFLDYPSIRNRILFWLSYTLDLEGFLHWGYAHWQTWSGVPAPVDVSPWMDATGGSIYVQDRQPLPAGDPFIVYPGRNGICGSIRWETVRQGMEDYEYLYMLSQVADGKVKAKRSVVKQARELRDKIRTEVAAAPNKHTRDDAVLLSTRDAVGELLAGVKAFAPETGAKRKAAKDIR
jgi:hypothetical protein